MNANGSLPAVSAELQEKIERKQGERAEQYQRLRELHKLNARFREITSLRVLELQEKLQLRELSAEEVLGAFVAKALEATDKFNCVTDFIPQSFEWAASLDGEPLSIYRPLRGLPVALKDDYNVEGMDSTLGFAKNLYKPYSDSAVHVKILRELGAIPFCKTNVPQSLFSFGSDNPIFGTTLNSLNPKMGPGGSSSGSASLVAAGGAAFATGSDFGGSLRVPAHFHGICTLRPTTNRLSAKGVGDKMPNSVSHAGVPGIIAPDAATLTLVMKALTENNIQNQFDLRAVPIPWNEKLFSSRDKLKIGYFTSLSYAPSYEDTKLTVLAAKNALESQGHQLVEFQVPDAFHYLKLFSSMTIGDFGAQLFQMFDGEPISPCIAALFNTSLETPMTERMKVNFGGYAGDIKTVADAYNRVKEKRAITEDILEKMEETGVDILLSPVMPHPAVKVEHGHEVSLGAAPYLLLWNFADLPAGVVRFGTESGKNVLCYDDLDEPIFKITKKALSESAGMPINVQVIGAPYKEELVLRVMLELEKISKNNY